MTIQYELPSLAARPAPVPPAKKAAATEVLSRAETAECTCPEFCERDHDQD